CAHQRRAGRSFAAARTASRDGVPELCALSAHAGVREYRLAPHDVAFESLRAVTNHSDVVGATAPRHGGNRKRSARGHEAVADRRAARAPAVATLRRPTPARGAWASDGASSRGIPDGRA